MTEAQVITTVAGLIEHLNGLGTETVSVEYVNEHLTALSTRTSKAGVRRGQLAGLSIEEMSDEQLKREKINASSVLYKAKQREAGQDTIDKNQARVDAVVAELAKRNPTPVVEVAADAEVTEAVAEEI